MAGTSLSRLFELVDAREYYGRMLGPLPKEDATGNVKVRCVFHDEAEGSLSISVLPGGVYYCHGCKAKGNLVTFHVALKQCVTIADAVQDIYDMFNIDEKVISAKYIDPDRLEEAHQALLLNKQYLEHLRNKRGIGLATVKEYQLGCEKDGRVTIPIKDGDGHCFSLRRWLPEFLRKTREDHETKIIGVRGYNSAALYPMEALRGSQILLCEGELDTLLLRERGFNAITPTGGVNTFKTHWLRMFKDKDVVLVYDNGEGGRSAAVERLQQLYPVVRSIKEVWLDSDIHGKDVTEYWYENPDDYVARLQTAIDIAIPWTKMLGTGRVYEVNLYQAARKDMIGKQIRLQARVIGREPCPMAVPHTVKLNCDGKGKACASCPMLEGKTIIFEADHPRFIDMITTPGRQHTELFREIFEVPCKTAKFEVVDMHTVEELRIMPEVDMADSTVEYAVRTVYFVGYGMSYNELYNLLGTTVVDPRTNLVTHIFSVAESVNKVTDAMSVTEELVIDGVSDTAFNHLTVFQPDNSVHNKLREIWRDLEVNVTRIIGRQDVLRAFDLLYHSAIGFVFDKEPIVKGWLDVLVIGDTQTGKSKTLERYRDFVMAGEVYSGENISKAGIIGGYISMPGAGGVRYVLGVWPLNDGRCVCIDEFSGLPSELIKELTMLRDHGVAESTKQAQRNRYPARVRFGMVSNPRDGQPMKAFSYGVEAISDLFGGGDADIARIDIAVAVAEDEIDPTCINQMQTIEIPHIYSSELCNLLLRWVWSRKSTHYIFEPEAIELCYKLATKMGETFDSSIPLVLAQSQRIKLARVAAAIAGRLFSTEDGEHVIVTKEHVDTAYLIYMEDLCKETMGYHTKSALSRRANALPNPAAVKHMLDSNSLMVYECLMANKRLQKKTLADYTGESQMIVDLLFRDMIQFRCLGQDRQYYAKTPGFIKFLLTYHHPKANEEKTYTAVETEVRL